MSFLDRIRELFKQSTQAARQPNHAARELLEHVSIQLGKLAKDLEQIIEAAAAGQDGPPRSVVEYVIKDRAGAELQTEWGDSDHITREQIMQCPGYQVLITRARQLGLHLKLNEEGCLDYADEDRNRFIMTLSGWD